MKDELTFDDLALIAGGHSAFQLLWSGIQLGVFNLLSKTPSINLQKVADGIGIEHQPARILMVGLTTLRLVEKNGDTFTNSKIIEQLLVSDSPENMIDVLGWQYHIVYPAEMDFLESLKSHSNVGLRNFAGSEDNLYARLAHDPKLEKIFHDAMSSLSDSANKLLAANVSFDEVNHLVDAGGGDGTNAITLSKANPHLKLTVFDAPSVCERAIKNIEAAGLSNRIDTCPGDFFETDFPPGIDAIIFAHMMTIWSAEKDTALLKRAYDALPDGGRVIIFNMMAYDDDTGPMTAALGSPYFLTIATGLGMMYSWKDYESFLQQAGFTQTYRQELPRDHGVLIGIK